MQKKNIYVYREIYLKDEKKKKKSSDIKNN